MEEKLPAHIVQMLLLGSKLRDLPPSFIVRIKGNHIGRGCFFFLAGLPDDVPDEMRLATDEVRMRVDIFAVCVAHLLEGVDVELADEGGHVVVLVVGGEHFLGESGNIADEEAVACAGPGHHVGQFFVLRAGRGTLRISSSLRTKSGNCELLLSLLRVFILCD